MQSAEHLPPLFADHPEREDVGWMRHKAGGNTEHPTVVCSVPALTPSRSPQQKLVL